MVLTDKLTAIGNAIRAKTGEADLLTLDEMPAAIQGITTGGGGGEGIPEEGLVLTGSLQCYDYENQLNWFIETYGDQITTKDLTILYQTFYGCDALKEIPFDFNFLENSNVYNYGNLTYAFYGCKKLEKIGKIKNVNIKEMNRTFIDCYRLRELPELVNCRFDNMHNSTGGGGYIFQGCNSLMSIPETYLRDLYNASTATYSASYVSLFSNCYALGEIKGLAVAPNAYTSNVFGSTFSNCSRLKELTFATDDGVAKVAPWKNQVIDLSSYVGYSYGTSNFVNYNSGLTADTLISDDTTYQALKDNPNSFTSTLGYSRYNHDSAVNTINSLPDTSATGTNTIKFNGAAGSLTDGGAINTLTTEEIAVAAAKGWTVTLI